jgi:transposase
MPVKTDRIDARNIAYALHAGWYRAVHVKSQATHKQRALLRSREMLIKLPDRTREPPARHPEGFRIEGWHAGEGRLRGAGA